MKLTKEQKTTLLNKFGGCCSYCGIRLGTHWQKDHVEPIIRSQRYIKSELGITQRDNRNKPIIESYTTHPIEIRYKT